MTGARRKLHVVAENDAPAAERIDIAALQRADIKKRDWAKVHVRGDRGVIVAMADAVTRYCDGRAMTLRPWRLG